MADVLSGGAAGAGIGASLGPIGAVVGGAVGAVGSMIANMAANGASKDEQTKALQLWLGANIPDPATQRIILQRYTQTGQLAPAFQVAIAQNPSAFNGIVTSQATKNAQSRALASMEQIGNEGGLRLQDKAALQDSMLQAGTQNRANREGIAATMARRGMGGSGFDVAAQLQGQQGVSDQNANNSLKIAANAQDRALQAIQGSGNLASQYRTQDFNEQAQRANASDAINRFNAQNAQGVNAANVGIANSAQAYNLGNQQDIANKNTDLSNQESLYNNDLAQQKFNNQLKVAAGATGQYNNMANTDMQTGNQMANAASNIGGAITGASAALAKKDYWDKYFADQEKKKASNDSGYSSEAI